MNFAYDFDSDSFYLQLSDKKVVLTQEPSFSDADGLRSTFHVDIASDGTVVGVEILGPGRSPWPIRELIDRYPFSVYEAYVLVTLAERWRTFDFA